MNQHGGKRNGAGRKPVDDPKIPLTIYIRKSRVKAVGGEDAARTLAIKAIERKAKIFAES